MATLPTPRYFGMHSLSCIVHAWPARTDNTRKKSLGVAHEQIGEAESAGRQTPIIWPLTTVFLISVVTARALNLFEIPHERNVKAVYFFYFVLQANIVMICFVMD